MKEPVKLRRKTLASGEQSLYLDIYQNGVRRYEFLKLYLVPERNAVDRHRNSETLRVAETIRAEKASQVIRGRFDFDSTEDINFWTFYDSVAEEKRAARRHSVENDVWRTAELYLKRYCSKPTLKLKDVTPSWCEGFLKSLSGKSILGRKTLARNSQSVVYTCLRTVMNEALRKGLITRSPLLGSAISNNTDTEKVYLTLEELQRMAATPTEHESLRKAFLFGCLTGLRKSDIAQLRWSDVTEVDGFVRLTFTQFKTGDRMYLDISEQAAQLMGERGQDDEHVFESFGSMATRRLRAWAKDAGVNKELTFHSSRHTFAVVMLSLDTDIYTVSKLLGHKSVSTTQVYAKVVDKKKREAVAKIPKLV